MPLDSRDDLKLTPLHQACSKGHLDTAIALIEKGASNELLTDQNMTPTEMFGLIIEGDDIDVSYKTRPQNVKGVKKF